jgi:hypothetical protein
VKDELMLVGVLTLLLDVAEHSFTPTHDVLEAFEWAHRLLFVAALVLVAFAVSLAAACAALTARYHAVEGVSLQGILSNEDREATIRVAHTDVRWREAATYFALREDFFARCELPAAFAFSRYLEGALKEFIVDQVEIYASAWGAVVCVVCANWARSRYFNVWNGRETDVFVGGGWLLVVLALLLRTRQDAAWAHLREDLGCATDDALVEACRRAHKRRSKEKAIKEAEASLELTIERREHRRELERERSASPPASPTSPKRGFVGRLQALRDHRAGRLNDNQHHARTASTLSACVSGVLLLVCFYGALLLLRYGALALEVSRSYFVCGLCGNQISGAPRRRRDIVSVAASARWRGDSTPSTRRCPLTHWLISTQVAAALPVVLVCDVVRRLVHRTSFVVAVSRVDEAAVDEVLEASLQTSHDVAALRVTFRQAFAAHGGKSRADLRAVFDHFEASGDGELDRDDARALIKWVLKRRISKDHFDRVWRELNVDEIGGIGFADFSSFFDDPAFQTPLLEAQIDLRGVATKKKKRSSFFHRKKSTKKVD